MKKLIIGLVLSVLLVMCLSLAEVWRSGSLRKQALSLKAGDTKADVRSVLGRPSYVFMPPSGTNLGDWLLSVHSETWAYGSTFDLRSAFRGKSPLRLRMFQPDSDEMAVVFGSSGRVSQVIIPGGAP
jgi:hypothetical protein